MTGMIRGLVWDQVLSFLLRPIVRMMLLAPSMVFMLVYMWSRNFPTTNVSFFGLITVEGRYLPWVMLVIQLCMGGDWQGDLVGLLVGHMCAP
jgi:Derlin-2/3